MVINKENLPKLTNNKTNWDLFKKLVEDQTNLRAPMRTAIQLEDELEALNNTNPTSSMKKFTSYSHQLLKETQLSSWGQRINSRETESLLYLATDSCSATEKYPQFPVHQTKTTNKGNKEREHK